MILLIVLFSFSPMAAQRIYADLGDFSESVEEGREEESGEKGEEKNEKEYRDDEDDDGGFWDTFFSITVILWYYHNRTAWYADYPYANDSGRPAAVGHDERLILEGTDEERKRSRWAFSSAGGMFMEGTDRGFTANFRFTGVAGGVFGPVLEYRVWNDPSATLHLYRVGGVLPLVQNDYFSLSLDFSGAFFRDAVYVDAVALGGSIVTYPFKPVSLEIRGGGIISETVSFSELGVRLGIHMSRFEVYAGYYGLFYDDTGLANQTTGLQSVELGTAVHF
jgi:hypothetical protein